MWLLEPEDVSDRENRLIALLNQEEQELTRYIKNVKELDPDVTKSENSIKLLQQFINSIKQQLGHEFPIINKPNSKDTLKQIGRSELYPIFCSLSQTVHANHATLWVYKREFDDGLDYEKRIHIGDWETPLRICYVTLIIAGRQFLVRFGGNPDEFICEAEQNTIEEAFKQLVQ